MDKFSKIRPYNDNEVQNILQGLIHSSEFLEVFLYSRGHKNNFINQFLKFLLPYFLKKRFKKIITVQDYQNLFEKILLDIISKTSDGFSCNGFTNLKPDKSYLFISNHRDITLDPALLNLALHQNSLPTVNIAVGSNLFDKKWVADLMRLNKSFLIPRSGQTKKEIYKSLKLVSEFIHQTISIKNESVWIAQRQGRAKDGIDLTDPAILKMLHLHMRKDYPLNEYLNSLRIIPTAITYEYDPNDIYKAQELISIDKYGFYKKSKNEDLESISRGISGKKGKICLNIGNPLTFSNQENSYDLAADRITSSIKSLFQPFQSHYEAKRILNKEIELSANHYFETKLSKQNKTVIDYVLRQYSNSISSEY